MYKRQALGATHHKIVVFGCQHGTDVGRVASADVLQLPLTCIAQMPPPLIEYALRDGASGVVVSGCTEVGCVFRLGQRWTAQRLRGTREPHLRTSVHGERVELVWADAGDETDLRSAVSTLRRRLADSITPTNATAAPAHG